MQKGKCIHFNGTVNSCCDAGVSYTDIASPLTDEQKKWHNENYPELPIEDAALHKRLPCFAHLGLSHLCKQYREPTPEELVEYEREILVHIGNTTKARNSIVAYFKEHNLPRSTAGVIPCPVCGTGALHFSRAGSNGHIHAKCTTDKCVYWME